MLHKSVKAWKDHRTKEKRKKRNKKEWREVTQVRIEVIEDDFKWSFPIYCPRWIFNIIKKLEL